MMVLVRIFGLLLLAGLILFGVWLAFVNFTGRENSMWFGGRPSTLGVKDGKLSAPRPTPNSVVSEGVESTDAAYVPPIAFTGDPRVALMRLNGGVALAKNAGSSSCSIVYAPRSNVWPTL